MTPRSLNPEQLNWVNWPNVNDADMSEFERAYFFRRKKALTMFVEFRSHAEIVAETGMPRQHVSDLLRRAQETHEDGRIFGFRACRYYARVKNYERDAALPQPGTKAGYAGALQQLLSACPTVARGFRELVMESKPEQVARLGNARLNRKFEDLCKAAGLTRADYPLNLPEGALSSVVRLAKQWIMAKPRRFAAIQGGARAARKFGSGARPPRPQCSIYQRVEFDGHRADGIFTIRMTNPDGVEAVLTLERIWLLVIRECSTGAILAHHLVLRKEYSSEDVLICIENAIRPWVRKALTIPGLEYPADGGFPSGSIARLGWAVWKELTFDNAAAHGRSIKSWVWDVVIKQLGCIVEPGPVATPDARLIEGLFRRLTQNGFQRMPGTTGKRPGDPRRADPEKEALAFDVSFAEMEEVIDVHLADFNGRASRENYGRCPLNALEYFLGQSGDQIDYIPEAERQGFCLTYKTKRIVVRGPLAKGYALHVNYMHVMYTSSQLGGAAALENTCMHAKINTRDLRTIHLYLPNGDDYGVITATGGWGITQHDLRVRRAIFDLVRAGKISLRDRLDPIEVFLRHLAEKKTVKIKRNRNMWAHTRRAAGRPVSEPVAPVSASRSAPAPVRPRKPRSDASGDISSILF